jgi:NitT/TauT family transport system ATP-binding protein
MGQEILVQVQDLEKYYPGQEQNSPTLSDISFQVNTGEVVAIMGHSGCGKSTLLNVIGGFVRPDRGRVLFKGVAVSRPQRTRVMLSQDYGLLPWRSVLKNVELGLEELSLTAQQRRQRAFDYLELVGLEESSEKFPRQLSGGMQQRVALARALAVQPELLLMDEPFAALDAFNRYRLQDELLRIQKHEKRTVIIVTHDIDEAIYLSDKVLIMRDKTGRIDREIAIDLPKPRDRGHSDFQQLRKIIFSEFVDKYSEVE